MSFLEGRGSRRAEASENALRLRGSVALPEVGRARLFTIPGRGYEPVIQVLSARSPALPSIQS